MPVRKVNKVNKTTKVNNVDRLKEISDNLYNNKNITTEEDMEQLVNETTVEDLAKVLEYCLSKGK